MKSMSPSRPSPLSTLPLSNDYLSVASPAMYQYYQVMVCLLKFDFFCFVGVTMQMLIVVLSRNGTEFGLTICAIPVVLVLLSLCGLAVKKEIKWCMMPFIALTVRFADNWYEG
jgi:hypothetical protein